jgi:transcriptional regulator with GAF, ATPase, and Fis domain
VATTSTREHHLVQTFVALAGSLVRDFDVVDVLQRLVDECVSLFDASAAGILLHSRSNGLEVAVSTTERSGLVARRQLAADAGPSVEAAMSGDVVSVDDVRQVADRWPGFVAEALSAGFLSTHSLPMRLREATLGSLTLVRDRPGALNEPDAIAARALADIATVSILQQRLVEEAELAQAQLQRALDSRVVLEQAKGYLARRDGIDLDTAFARIRGHARATQTRIGVVAAEVVAGRLSL